MSQKVDNMATNITASFRSKVDLMVGQINDVDGFREGDQMVDFVFKVGRELFDTPLDQQTVGQLIRNGGKLTGAYSYLGQKAAFARGERDVYVQKYQELEKERLLKHIGNDMKITEARSKVKLEMSELDQYVVEKEVVKNQWENITNATEKMISFIQSAIKVKEGERFQNSRNLRDNMG